jgi:SH3-like domain-containing protein
MGESRTFGDHHNDNYPATATAPWQPQYTNALAGRAGEPVVTTERVEDWRETPGWAWRWCRDAAGREGWAPEALLALDGAEATLREDYDATELGVTVGARVTVERELSGWALCRTEDGARGWVPLECLTTASEGSLGNDRK